MDRVPKYRFLMHFLIVILVLDAALMALTDNLIMKRDVS
jgi:hypothetical protein